MRDKPGRILLTGKNLQFEQPAESLIALVLQKLFARHAHPAIIAVGGPGGTGKSTLCDKLSSNLSESVILGLDNYRTPRAERQELGIFGSDPKANHMDLVKQHLECIRAGKAFDRPCYDLHKGIADTTQPFTPSRYTILDGEISVYKQFWSLVDFSIFVDAHWRTQLATRIYRDVDERGATPEKALRTFLQSNLIDAPVYSGEAKPWADIVLHCTDDFRFALQEVSENVWKEIKALQA